jgi:hypothetical protein
MMNDKPQTKLVQPSTLGQLSRPDLAHHKSPRELLEELRDSLAGQAKALDAILPPLLFVVTHALAGLQAAVWVALGLALALAGWRLLRRQPLLSALGGAGGVVLAALVAWLLGSAEGYFVPGLASGGLALLVTVGSLAARRPLVAWTSHLARRWPRAWYWHPRVRPAYSEVTVLWALVFALRLALQLVLYRDGNANLLGLASALTGWPVTIALLVVTYLYGTWRLQDLAGPSVEEFAASAQPPWHGQRTGF